MSTDTKLTQKKKLHKIWNCSIWNLTGLFLVREKGLEPSRLAALAPKASVSTNSTTRACVTYHASVSTIIYSKPPLAH